MGRAAFGRPSANQSGFGPRWVYPLPVGHIVAVSARWSEPLWPLTFLLETRLRTLDRHKDAVVAYIPCLDMAPDSRVRTRIERYLSAP